MTLVVVTAQGSTPDELLAATRAAARHADWVEVRLDGPSGLPWDLRPFFALDKPALATVRAQEDGGRSAADDEARAELLRRALLAGAHAIDVELASDAAKALVHEAHARGARAVVSVHDLEGTPDADALLVTLRRMRAMGADVAKVATTVRGPRDAEALVRAALSAREEGIPAAVMAVNDPFLRLLASALGLALVYVSAPGAPPAAPGQVAAEAVRHVHLHLQPAIRSLTRAAYILGHPVAHSRSPAMQTAALRAAGIDAVYLALDVAPERLAAALDALRFSIGANVTVPHKVAAMRLVDDLDGSAKEAGALNTIAVRDGRLVGYNTDGDGGLDALREAGAPTLGAKALVLGAGGAARAVVAALRRAGAEVTVAARDERKAAEVQAKTVAWSDVTAMLQRTDLLVNATTLGLRGEEVPFSLPQKRITVLDCVYAGGGSPLVRRARSQGHLAIGGEAMLLHQGARSFRIWTGKEAPIDVMRAALGAGP